MGKITAHDPIPRKALPCPQAAAGGDGNEVAVAPEGVGIVCIGVDGAFELSGELLKTRSGVGCCRRGHRGRLCLFREMGMLVLGEGVGGVEVDV